MKMKTSKKAPTPLDIFPSGKTKKKAAKTTKAPAQTFKGEINMEKFQEALKSKKFSERNIDVARDFFGYNGITQSVSHEGRAIGVYINTDSGYAVVMEWGDLQRLAPRDNPKFFNNLEEVHEHCVNVYQKNPYRPSERYNVNRHW
jgi:hypothetical protein